MLISRYTALVSVGALALALALPAATRTVRAQGKTLLEGIYSEAQSTRGATAATASCTVCHGDQLKGSDMGPGMGTAEWKKAWAGRSLGELFDKIKTTMPANDPGSLNAAATADLVAYILKLGGYPAGSSDLPADQAALGAVKIQ